MSAVTTRGTPIADADDGNDDTIAIDRPSPILTDVVLDRKVQRRWRKSISIERLFSPTIWWWPLWLVVVVARLWLLPHSHTAGYIVRPSASLFAHTRRMNKTKRKCCHRFWRKQRKFRLQTECKKCHGGRVYRCHHTGQYWVLLPWEHFYGTEAIAAPFVVVVAVADKTNWPLQSVCYCCCCHCCCCCCCRLLRRPRRVTCAGLALCIGRTWTVCIQIGSSKILTYRQISKIKQNTILKLPDLIDHRESDNIMSQLPKTTWNKTLAEVRNKGWPPFFIYQSSE